MDNEDDGIHWYKDTLTDSGTHTTADSHYAAKHQVGSAGQAVGGTFSADSKEVSERGTKTKLVEHDEQVANTTTYGHDEDSNTEDTTKTTTTSNESGSYQDERQTAGNFRRVQTGSYNSTQILDQGHKLRNNRTETP